MKRILLALLFAVLPLAGSAQIATPGGGGPYVVATAGPVTLTGIVAETVMASLRIPAGSMGPNGVIDVTALWSTTNSANNKTIATRWQLNPGLGGFNAGAGIVLTTVAAAQTKTIIRNSNATNAQVIYTPAAITPFGTGTAAVTPASIDTTADTYISLTGTIAAAGETLTLNHAYAVVYKQ
jgi:hypothetical protein